MKFIIAYFLFSDAYSTIASVGVIFAIEELDFRTMEVALLVVIAPGSAAVGIIFFRWFQIHTDKNNKEMVLITLGTIAFMVAYGICGYSGGEVKRGVKHGWSKATAKVLYHLPT